MLPQATENSSRAKDHLSQVAEIWLFRRNLPILKFWQVVEIVYNTVDQTKLMSGLPDCHVKTCLYHPYAIRDTQKEWPSGPGLHSEQVSRQLVPKIYPSIHHPSIHSSSAIHPSVTNLPSIICQPFIIYPSSTHHSTLLLSIPLSLLPSLHLTSHSTIHPSSIHTYIHQPFINSFRYLLSVYGTPGSLG